MTEFDYIIVGGGSGGCTLAGRLSEDPRISVCLIEAGGPGTSPIIRTPSGVASVLPTPLFNWAFKTVPQEGLNGRRGYQPRGRALGGSSAINAMLYIRGHQRDYDEWRDLGNLGWGWDDVLPYFKRAEGNGRGEDELHGADGPLSVSDQRSPHAITDAFLEAARENQIPMNGDFNGSRQEGIGKYQVTQKNGERCSAAAAYIIPNLNRANLTVMTKTRASKVNFQDGRAVSVSTFGKGGNKTLNARREIILCGGSFNTPQLLMLSGVGPAEHLRSHGIEVVADRPEVGENLQDHIDYVTAYKSGLKDTFGLSFKGLAELTSAIFEWRKHGTGKLTSPMAEAGGFVRSSPDLDRPDLQYHFVVGALDDHLRKIHFGHGFSCHVCVLRPKSRGRVQLNSAKPTDTPLIDMGFFSQRDDLDLMTKGFRMMRQLLESPALEPWRKKELYTANLSTDAELEQIIRNRADTVYHPVGTCRMGSDEASVVDPELRVRGVKGLRVADGSIMPRIIGGNTNAPIIMIGEKCADMLRSSAAA